MSRPCPDSSYASAFPPHGAPIDSGAVPYVYAFDHKHRRPPMEFKDLLGGKGANLAEMTSVLKLPVPPGFTISTDACRAYMHGGWPAGLDDEIATQVAKLEKAMGRTLGDAADPLLVSVRSGAKFSMPGMMDTVLNLGLNDESVKGLADGHRRRALRLRQLPPLHLDVRPHRARHRRRALRPPARGGQGDGRRRRPTPSSPPTALKELCDALQGGRQGRDRQAVPAGPDQAAARRHRGRVHAAGTAPAPSPTASASASATTSAPPSTCRRWCSATATTTRGTGVGFTRNAATGENKPYGDFLDQRPGRGRRRRHPQHRGPRRTWSATSRRSTTSCSTSSPASSATTSDMCDTEFTIEQGKLWMLQTRVGKRTGAAALRMAVDMTKGTGKGAGPLEDQQATRRCMRVTADHLDQVLHPQFAGDGQGDRQGPRRLAGRRRRHGRTSPPTTPPTPPSAARTSSSCAARPAPRTSTA